MQNRTLYPSLSNTPSTPRNSEASTPPQPPHTSPPPWALDHRPKSSFPSSQLHDDLLHHLGRVSGPMHYSPCSQCASVTRLRRFGSDKYISIRVDDSGFSVFPSTWFTPLRLFSIPSAPAVFWDLGVDFLSYSTGACFSLLGFFVFPPLFHYSQARTGPIDGSGGFYASSAGYTRCASSLRCLLHAATLQTRAG
jgi:hypothetical protein